MTTPIRTIITAGHELALGSLRELEQKPDAGPVWVLNTSSGTRRGDVVLTVARNNGIGSDTVVIPATWIPIDLTTMVSRSQLLRDNQFRQAMVHNLLTLVNADDAEKLFVEDDAANRERARLSSYLSLGAVAFAQQQTNGEVEVFGDNNPGIELPAPVENLLQRIQIAAKNNELDEQAEIDFEASLRNFGSLSEEVYTHIHHATAKLAPRVSKLAKKLARLS